MKRVVVLISGRGSNLIALHRRLSGDSNQTSPTAQLVGVISNKPEAGGIVWARSQGIPSITLDHRRYPNREAFEAVLAREVHGFRPDLVVLAGFMRVLGSAFVRQFAGHLINIHPSLLPAFPGLDTHRRAIDAGVCLHGATVHFVNEALDGGPIIAQAAVAVLPTDDEQSLADRVLREEHRLLPQVVIDFCSGFIALDDQGRLQCGPQAKRLWFSLPSGAA
ncbi:MAG: phosphoribosylglycinamide formyltransferase [Betaproteobacteria bacterium]|jgi:phosphoribosylglycinamide formyltransferase-1|nr:phosphoribosylglycinamide formyltransferase [Betaproteobacteria bacterium]HAB48322.1 phosphoribosylglycinamide formyltransferase [Lautropia sp.]NBP35497.1 phosphoribosylglycinamide formyltransferase [Betaproteobacteria bacterium]NBP38693.1 phosphoribosylglycinamide formyltransferase [Betaproteobacteria bacterium]NBQ95758.1 phosphoribosylglycinamide formyltransferase [Betaproteobacteria bacterium]